MTNDQSQEPNRNQETGTQLIPFSQLPARRDPYGGIALAGYPASVADASEPSAFNLREIWRILNKHKWLILGIAAAFVVLAAVRTLMQTPLYTSTVRLQIDRNVAQVVKGENVLPSEDASDFEFSQTQYELLRSRMMAQRVASALRLGEDSDFLKPRGFSVVGAIRGLLTPRDDGGNVNESALQDVAAGILPANLTVQPVGGSRLVDVSYSDPDPARAQRIANGYADAFLASNIDKRFQANASAKTFLEDKIQQLKLRLEESEKKLLAFAQEQQLVDINDKSSIAESNVLQSNNLIESLRGKRKDLEIEYQQKLEIFKPSYPVMLQIKKQIDEIDRQLTNEQERILALKQDALDLQKRSIQYNILKREVDTNRDLYTSLLQRYKEVDVASGVGANNVFVIDRAGLPTSPSSPRLSRALVMALILGLGAGIGVAYILERLDDKIRSIEQVELIAGLTALGVIPLVRDVEEELADPRSALCEAYRSLCTGLQFATESGLPKTLAITSSGPSEGKSLTATLIAKHFATMGHKVLLVDADLRNPSLHLKLNRDNSVGLSNYLTGACTPPDAMQKTEIPNLAFMASGPLPPNAADLLGGARLHSLLSIGSEVFDLIVIDGPPVLGLADAQLLSSAAAATIFVIGAGTSRTGLVRGALRRLQLSQGYVIGAVLTKHDAKAAGYGYGYDYSYSYSYGSGAKAKPMGPTINNPPTRKPQLADLRERLANMRESA
jgi:capsular exopolysaccharide synthesis family protein